MKKVFDIIRRGVFKNPELEALRVRALRRNDYAIERMNEVIQDCKSEEEIAKRLSDGCYLYPAVK